MILKIVLLSIAYLLNMFAMWGWFAWSRNALKYDTIRVFKYLFFVSFFVTALYLAVFLLLFYAAETNLEL